MGRDASLNEFLSGERVTDEPAEDSAVEPGKAIGDPGEQQDGPLNAAINPAIPTYDWTPGGAECAGCGATVKRRWREGDGLVCGDCKEW